ncbi:transposase [Corynebacterium diphtheriae]|uniref:transposase n=1 Tax=Corynebacterium diphtheriae TaxID=1717 RepID=UPI001055ED50|nr:transposase [Corynebacterium diphtheriae]
MYHPPYAWSPSDCGLPAPEQRHAATAGGIGRRAADGFDHGLSHTGSPRRRFIPNGPHAKAYNTCMTTFAARHDVIEEGRLSAPALPTRIDPYKNH